MDEDALERAYERCVAAHRGVAEAMAAYEAAVRWRAECVRELRNDWNQSFYKISKRLGLSASRVAQIVASNKAD